MKVSFVIPSYRAHEILDKNLDYLLDYIKSKQLNAEVIIVDDGSNDGDKSKVIADKKQCTYLSYPKNKGKGGAVKYGMSEATGDIKIFTDADIPFESNAFDQIIQDITIKDFDMVIGDRTLDDSVYFTEITNSRKFGSSFFTFFVGRIVTTGIFDTQCGIKGFKKEVADDLFQKSRITSFAFDVEIIYIALKRNYTIRKIPVKLRSQEASSVSLLKHAPGMLLDLFTIKLNHLRSFYQK